MIGAVLIGCAVIFLVGRTVGIFDFGQESGQVTMIAVENMTEEEAVNALTEMGAQAGSDLFRFGLRGSGASHFSGCERGGYRLRRQQGGADGQRKRSG